MIYGIRRISRKRRGTSLAERIVASPETATRYHVDTLEGQLKSCQPKNSQAYRTIKKAWEIAKKRQSARWL